MATLSLIAPVAAQGDPCQTGADDGLEDNDSCQAAVSIAQGTHPDLVVRPGDPDYFSVVVPPGDELVVSAGGPSVFLLDSNCQALPLGGTGKHTNASGAPEQVVIEVTSAACQVYDLVVSSAPNPCFVLEADSCQDPVPIPASQFASDTASIYDGDYWSFCLPAGASTIVQMNYPDHLVQMFLDVYDATKACTQPVAPSQPRGTGFLEVLYTNTTGADQLLVVGITVGSLLAECEQYVLTISNTAECASPTVYCTGKLSSAGCVPMLDVSGFPSASALLPFRVDASDVVNWKNGIVFYGFAGPINAPFLGGTLCVTPPLKRSPVMNSGGSPPNQSDCTGTYDFDFNAWIQSGLDPLLVAGQQVNAQVWFRDPPSVGGAGLSNATEFVILP